MYSGNRWKIYTESVISREFVNDCLCLLNLPQIGFDLGEASLNEAGKALRLLHVEELRLLQTQINEAIVAAQSQTADPKTDTSLGQVGRWSYTALVSVFLIACVLFLYSEGQLQFHWPL